MVFIPKSSSINTNKSPILVYEGLVLFWYKSSFGITKNRFVLL